MEDDLVKRAASIAEYTDTSVIVSERAENGDEAPPEWFGMNPADGEDSAKVIDSSGEEEGGAEEEGEGEVPEVGVDGQPQLDRASNNEPRLTEPATTVGDQAETSQPAAPPVGAADSAVPPSPPAAS